jgi:hypothetical protein
MLTHGHMDPGAQVYGSPASGSKRVHLPELSALNRVMTRDGADNSPVPAAKNAAGHVWEH